MTSSSFFNVDLTSYGYISKMLVEFGAMSGLQINKSKLEIWFNPNTLRKLKKLMAKQITVQLVSKIGKHLGTYLDAASRKKDIGAEIIDKMRSKLQGWKSRMLSRAGRLTLCKSVLQNLPVYHLATTQNPKGCLKEINRIITRFWKGELKHDKKLHLISEHRTIVKNQGGLGMLNISILNVAMLAKQIWRVISQPNLLLSRVIILK